MKQKIVIKVTMRSEKMQSKAMQIVAAEPGVISMTIIKDDEMVVTGEGIDAACLIMSLRKKFCYVEIVSVEEVKPPPPPPPRPPPPPPLCPPPCPPPCPPFQPLPCPPYPPYYCPSPCQAYVVCPVNDPNPPDCSIM
ncbi:heavy metal-associated isoprenylated plant protein 47-like [Olea europaea var. sylvestris]|uniref:heavy metal-associated isoprenylated plant protein 47-like n=1 Tax=Olea europaea var. sylvestris TaxID=158386 RepID=UPI000C1D8104|nr:heavy metal-associated isoprenylated plant protein 47-like [Olea europaea var. sylvestris]